MTVCYKKKTNKQGEYLSGGKHANIKLCTYILIAKDKEIVSSELRLEASSRFDWWSLFLPKGIARTVVILRNINQRTNFAWNETLDEQGLTFK